MTRAEVQQHADVGTLASAVIGEPDPTVLEAIEYVLRVEWTERNVAVDQVLQRARSRKGKAR